MSLIGRALGKLPVRRDPRTLRLATYLTDVPAPPPARDWADRLPVDLGMYRNAELGTCAIASTAHLQQAWTSQHGLLSKPTEAEVVAAYAAVSGYRPSDPTSDRGCDMLAVCNYWRKVGIAGNRILAYVKLDHDDWLQLRVAANLFGGLFVGAALPRSSTDTSKVWDLKGPPIGDNAIGSWGGHAMALVAYSRWGVCFVTWGRRQWASWAWFYTYCDEAYAVLDETWSNEGGVSPSGLNLAELERDVRAVASA